MEPLLLYLGKMILCSGVLFVYYRLFLKDKTFHHYNRFYLLSLVIVSLLLPMIKVSYFTIELNRNFYLLFNQLGNNNNVNTQDNDISFYPILYAVIGVVSIILLARLVLGILKINGIKKAFPNENIEGIRFYQTDLNNAPFSFFRNLFWRKTIELDSPVGRQILKHEMVHIEQKHSWDKLMMQIVKSVFWFNPVFYFVNKEINLIHEYLADNKAVKKSDTKAFAQMLLESHFSGAILPATSPFLSSNIKKRLKMITKSKTKYSYARKLFALPILFFIVFAYLVNAKNREILETNKAIEIAVKQLKNDTVITKEERVTKEKSNLPSQKGIDIVKKAKEASDQALFIVKGEEVSKSEFLKFVEQNQNNDDMAIGYSSSDMQTDNEHLVYGGKEKEGVFSADRISDMLKNTDKYHKLIKKYNPKWYEDQIVNNKYGKQDAEKKIKAAAFPDNIVVYKNVSKKEQEEVIAKAEAKAKSKEFKIKMSEAEKAAALSMFNISSADLKRKIEEAQKRSKNVDDMINSPEFQIRIKNAFPEFDSEEFKKRIENAKALIGTSKFYSDEDFQKMIKEKYGKDAFTDGTVAYGVDASKYFDFPGDKKFEYFNKNSFDAAKSKLSPKELKKLEKKRKQLADEQKELWNKQRELQKKQMELNKEYVQNSPWVISVKAQEVPTAKANSYVAIASFKEDSPNFTYYLNGEKISDDEFKEINPKEVKSIDVEKDKVNTIKIVTK